MEMRKKEMKKPDSRNWEGYRWVRAEKDEEDEWQIYGKVSGAPGMKLIEIEDEASLIRRPYRKEKKKDTKKCSA